MPTPAMTEEQMSFLDQAVGTVVASVLAVTAAVGSPAAAPDQPDRPQPSTQERNPLADKVEADVGKDLGRDSIGHDISWPNCPVGMGIPARRTLGKPLPPAFSRYVIIGLTNGPAFFPNPCLGQQVAYARRQHLWTAAYAVVTYPTPSQLQEYGGAGPRPGADLAARLWNTGWAQARVNIDNLRAAGLSSPIVWLDVEPVRPPAPWSGDVSANRTVLEGSMAAYRKAGFRLGVYSTQYLWRSVVGDVGYGLPEWRAAGPTSRQHALALCRRNVIQGGDVVLTQWSSVDIDTNVLCPGRPVIDVLWEFFTPN